MMKLWRAYYRYADYECQATTVLAVGVTKAEVDESLLLHYESLSPDNRIIYLGSFNGNDCGDLLELVTIEEFESGEIWDI
jgi:hypothetical protein